MQRAKGLLFRILAMLLCVSSAAAEDELRLARELFRESDWENSQRECRRVLISRPDRTEAQMLAAICNLRLERDIESSRHTLARIADEEDTRMDLRTLAAYEAGRSFWHAGDPRRAYPRLVFAFLHSPRDAIFLRAGCSLFLLMRADKSLASKSPGIYSQIRSNRDLYDWNLQKECLPEETGGTGILAKPGEWGVAIYRSQIAPAIGMRCSCIPSCSEYFLQASRKHGLLGFPLQADRFFREPSHVQRQIHPVGVGDQIKYSDPLSDHDFWLK